MMPVTDTGSGICGPFAKYFIPTHEAEKWLFWVVQDELLY